MDTSEVPESSPTNIEFDDIWVGCIVWCFEWNFEAWRVGKCSYGKWKIYPGFGNFNLEVKKRSSTAFEVAVNRKREEISMPSDGGCYLKCHISVVGGDKPRTVLMRFGEYRVGTIFQYNEIDNSAKDAGIFTVLCAIKMSETSVLSNEESSKQNKFIEDLKTNDNAQVMEDMAFLLKRKSLDNIFTGRQTTDFAELKTGMIARTLPFAHEIAKKVRYKQRDVKYEPRTSPEVYLRYIFDEYVGRINKEQLFNLHLNAHFCGLQYLVSECIDYMVFKTEPEDLVRILTLSEITFDSELSSKATIAFLQNIQKIRKTSTWKYFIEHEPITRFILDSVRRNFNAKGNRVFDGWLKKDKEHSKQEQTTPILPRAGKDGEDANQHSGEKQNIDKESNTEQNSEKPRGATEKMEIEPIDEKQNTGKDSKTQQNSTEVSGGATQDMEEAGASSNMERYLNGSASSSTGEKMECSSAHEKYAMASSHPDQNNGGFFPGEAEEDADGKRKFPGRLPTTAEVSNPEHYSFDEPHNVSEGGEKFELISTNNKPAVYEEVSDTGYSNNKSNVKAVNGAPKKKTSNDGRKNGEVESSTYQHSTEGSDSTEAERLERNSDEQKRPEKHTMDA